MFVRFSASLRGDLRGLPARFSRGTLSATADTLTWQPRWALRRRQAGFDVALLQLQQVRDTVPSEVVRLNRSCKVFEFNYLGGTVSLAVHPDDLPTLRAALRGAASPGPGPGDSTARES